MQRDTEPNPSSHRHSVHQMRRQIDGAQDKTEHPGDQNTADQHQRRVVELLGIALTRLNGRSGLSKSSEQIGSESSRDSELAVGNG